MSVSHNHPTHSHTAPRHSDSESHGTLLQRFLDNRFACFVTMVALVLAVRFSMVQWLLVGGFPSETMVANVMSMLVAGVLIGAVEGRLYVTYKASQQVLGMALSVFLERARLLLLLGSIAAIILATFLELGLSFRASDTLMGALSLSGAAILSVLTGFVTLWISFSWSRWCFGEIHWN